MIEKSFQVHINLLNATEVSNEENGRMNILSGNIKAEKILYLPNENFNYYLNFLPTDFLLSSFRSCTSLHLKYQSNSSNLLDQRGKDYSETVASVVYSI